MNNIFKSIKSLIFSSTFFIFFTPFIVVGAIALWYFSQESKLASSPENLDIDKETNTVVIDTDNTEQKDNSLNIKPEEESTVSNGETPPSLEMANPSLREEKVNTIENSQNQGISSPQATLPNKETPPTRTENIPQNQENINSLLLKNTRYGHFPFAEAPRERLMNMGKYYHRTEYLDQEAGMAFQRMKQDAQSQGVQLVLISGFRSIASQEELFKKQTQRRGSEQAAAKLSAPPGHSEHHTGYALDIGDGKKPELDLKYDFESTQAYQWLNANARNYGFELSFPRNNPQGVSFEPWHWRYVASERARNIFAQTRSLR